MRTHANATAYERAKLLRVGCATPAAVLLSSKEMQEHNIHDDYRTEATT